MKKTFKIPVVWSVSAMVNIEAESLEEAVRIFDKTIDDIPLPTDNNYLDESFMRSSSKGSGCDDIEDDVGYYKLFND